MDNTVKQIYIFGAGFTKAFCPNAPLLVDDFGTYDLIEKYANFPIAQQILKLEHKKGNSKINIEQLLTRLYSGMPYDSQIGTNAQIQMLRSDVVECLLNKLAQTRQNKVYSEELGLFAKHCIEKEITCITLNYDDIFDEALYNYRPRAVAPGDYWHPDGGYGFFCKPMSTLSENQGLIKDECAMDLLKLHGSINWFIKTGYQSPYSLDAVVHQQEWLRGYDDNRGYSNLDKFVSKDPFIIPPVLMKSEITEQPLIRTIWQIAYEQLKNADAITFVGYSLPLTDIAVRFLFRESLASKKAEQIKVINKIIKPSPQNELIRTYKGILPDITEKQFDFRDALDWVRDLK